MYNARARLSLRMRTQHIRVYARFLCAIHTHAWLMHAKEQKTLWTDHVAVNVAILKRIYSLSRAYVCSLTKKFYFYLLGDLEDFFYLYLFILLHCVLCSIYSVGYVLRLDSGEVKTRKLCKNIVWRTYIFLFFNLIVNYR